MNSKTEKKILDFLNKNKNLINLKELSKKVGISYPTLLKYVEILSLKKKISVKDYGNVKLVEKI